MYQDFCERCGSAIDPKTGRCPDCTQRTSRAGWIIAAVVVAALVLAVTVFQKPIIRSVTKLTRQVEIFFAPKPEPPAGVDSAVEPLPAASSDHPHTRDEAVEAARTYLDSDIFSPISLSQQLSEDGYNEADITYALENCGADWYETAAYCAADWVANYYYSRALLVEDLVISGFSEDEAEYGAEYCGANWSEEATYYGSYLLEKNPDLSAKEVSAELLDFGYTEEEVQYAIEQLFGNSLSV